MARKPAAIVLTAGLFAAAAFFELYVIRGALSAHSLLNIEGIVAVAFLLVLFMRARAAAEPAGNAGRRANALAVLVIAGVIVAAFAAAVASPFLYDDYTHIADARVYNWGVALHQFGRETRWPGLFFRPAGFFLYWLNYLGAGANPALWHAGSLALHAAVSCLVYALCRECGIARTAALAAALLFAVHGAAAETVAWIDARFDLMAALLVLLAVLAVSRYARTGGWTWLAGALGAGAAAMLTKESGFALPLLIASLALFPGERQRKRVWLAAASSGALAGVLFAYRWWALGGIGGYRGAGGPQIAQFNLAHALNGLFFREWAVLFFPFNWSMPAGLEARSALAAIPLLLGACALMSRASRPRLLGCIAITVAASLPVQHLLLIGTALGGTRNLYMATVGWAMLLGVMLDGMHRRAAVVLACLLLAADMFVLEHNLAAWREAADVAKWICTGFGRSIAGTRGNVAVRGLPATRMGAVFLHNGFPQCVEMNSGFPAARVQVLESGEAAPPGSPEFVWSDTDGRLEER